ncbi:hypothetical protein Tco_0145247 [Tanacetum coccineum]
MYKVDHSEAIKQSVQANLINKVKNQLPKLLPKVVSDFVTLRIKSIVSNVLQKNPAFPTQSFFTLAQPTSRAAESLSELELKQILFDKMEKSLSYMKHDKHQELCDALLNSIMLDEAIASGNVNLAKESSKGKTLPKTSKTYKSVTAEEPVEEHVHEMAIDVEEPTVVNVVNDDDQPQDDAAPRKDNSTWFKQPPRLEISNPEWNQDKSSDDASEQTWFNNMVDAMKDLLTFDELMSTLLDFSKFSMNRLKLDKLTKEDLVVNHEGNICPTDMSKPLHLQDKEGLLTILVEFFFNNDLEYLKAGNMERKYSSSITKTKAVRYTVEGIEEMIPRLWRSSIVAYNKGVKLGICHWDPNDNYSTCHKSTSCHDMMSSPQ